MEPNCRWCSAEDLHRLFFGDHPEENMPDFNLSDLGRSSHFIGVEFEGAIRGAIAITANCCEQDEDDFKSILFSFLDIAYVGIRYRKHGLATALLTSAINFLIDAEDTPIGCAFTSGKAHRVFLKLPVAMQNMVRPKLNYLVRDIWEERNL